MNWLKRSASIFVVLLSLVIVGTAVAQETNSLELKLNRDFGAAYANNIQGRFSFRVDGPDNLESVSFYIDNQLVGEDSEAPFRLQFETDNYDLGTHTLYAIGRTTNGEELRSNEISRNFISSSSSNRTLLLIVVPILVISLGGGIIATWVANRGRKSSSSGSINAHGPFGGTICPKCNKPFARHIWGLNLGLAKFDRCPHCGKWSLVRALPPAVLDEAIEAIEAESKQNQPKPPSDDDESWRKRLDDSKFDS